MPATHKGQAFLELALDASKDGYSALTLNVDAVLPETVDLSLDTHSEHRSQLEDLLENRFRALPDLAEGQKRKLEDLAQFFMNTKDAKTSVPKAGSTDPQSVEWGVTAIDLRRGSDTYAVVYRDPNRPQNLRRRLLLPSSRAHASAVESPDTDYSDKTEVSQPTFNAALHIGVIKLDDDQDLPYRLQLRTFTEGQSQEDTDARSKALRASFGKSFQNGIDTKEIDVGMSWTSFERLGHPAGELAIREAYGRRGDWKVVAGLYEAEDE